jgi:CubicO group peptidase (beta-lactamase class C family)
MTGGLLSPASFQKMTTPFKSDYALGVLVSESSGRKSIGHNGGIDGFITTLNYYPAERLTVVVLGNQAGPAPVEIAAMLAGMALEEKVVLRWEHKEIDVDAATLTKYVGEYQLQPRVVNTITLENGRLMTQLTGQSKFPLFAESPTLFFLKVADAQVEFAMNDQGFVTHLLIHQNGNVVKATKK